MYSTSTELMKCHFKKPGTSVPTILLLRSRRLIPSRIIRQMLAIFLDLNSKRLYQSSRKEKESCVSCSRPRELGIFTSYSCGDGKEMYKTA